ncbi:flagellar biosynthesis protein FlhB [Neorhizobium sp. P12A]|uniref:flagellar biosynthesis protein FlhB n=1 Tax=Rhizobium/Agrobacterium group TaxID=227290 RepID=UPI0010437329|nr:MULTISPECIES: flagellar biosynthesis protein FlhB [Rhizobium/Agrobacterium group]KAA0699498.1 flagellar biosynthesis protein FlhB [Neorhizobium sp. P12A]TCR91096.1 flagellar biosynthetic protein FlhB [Rhizobium sp. BK376]
MADEDKDSKTEDPTGKKMQDAVLKGNIPVSREITLFASMLATFVYLIFFLPDRVGRMGEILRDLFEKSDQWNIETGPDVMSLFARIGWEVAYLMLPAIALFFVFGIGSSFAQNMPSFVWDRLMPDFSRVSPTKGWQRIASVPGLIEFGKALTKVLIVGVIMFFVLRSDFLHAIDALYSDPQTLFVRLFDVTRKILLVVLLASAVIGAIDLFWTRHHWYEQLKMTKQEVKDEFKQSQGDPAVKGRQRALMRARARQRMMNNVPRATLVIANPTHFAVALRYVREENDAPVVVAKGQDLIALRIREIAEEAGIPVFEDPPLARSMFAQVSVDSVIPSVFYKAVAELIHRIYAAQSNKKRVR